MWGCDLWPWELMGRVGRLAKIAFLCIEKQSASAICGKKKQNLSSFPMIQGRIQKARKAFPFGSAYAFQGNLSPVSSWLIVQIRVLPILPQAQKDSRHLYCAFYSGHKFSPKSHLRPNPPLWIYKRCWMAGRCWLSREGVGWKVTLEGYRVFGAQSVHLRLHLLSTIATN